MLNQPPIREAINGFIPQVWARWFISVVTNVNPQGGATSERPSPATLYQSYYDTTLGKPIWWDGIEWKDSTGATV